MGGARSGIPLFPKEIQKLSEQVRRLNRHTHTQFPPLEPILETFDNGVSLGPTRFLDFGAGITATVTFDGYVEITSAAVAGGTFDATVDGNQAEDATARIYSTPLRAGAALAADGFQRANILVVPMDDGSTYTEAAAAFTVPATVVLYGAAASNSTRAVKWNPQPATSITSNVRWRTTGIEFLATATETDVLGTGSQLVTDDCQFSGVNFQPTWADIVVATGCTLDRIQPLATSECYLVNADIQNRSSTAVTLSGITIWRGCTMYGASGGVDSTVTIGSVSADLEFVATTTGRIGTGALGKITWTCPSGARLRMRATHATSDAIWIVASAGNAGCDLDGGFGNINLAAPASGTKHTVKGLYKASGAGGVTISGTANVEFMVAAGSGEVVLASACIGHITNLGYSGTGTFLTISGGANRLSMHGGGGVAGAGAKPYAFGAAATHNFIIWNFIGSWPAVGTDASGSGTNVVLTTPLSGSVPAIAPGSGWTAGSVIFANASGVLSENNAQLSFDDTNDVLHVTDFIMGDIGAAAFDFYGIAHEDNDNLTDYALVQSGAGTTFINAKTGQSVGIRINNADQITHTALLATYVDAYSVAVGSTTGHKWGTAATQKQAWWNAAPIVQPANTVALDTLLTNVGFRAAGGTSARFASKIYPPTDAAGLQTAAGLYAGTGAPNNANGANGDFYFRSDGGALTTIYQRRAAAWVGLI